MKFLIPLLITLPLSAFSAQMDAKVVKLKDGKVFSCKRVYDAYRFAAGAYSLTNTAVTKLSDGTLKIDTDVKFMACEKQGDKKVATVEKAPYDLIMFEKYGAPGKNISIEGQPQEVKMMAYQDGIYEGLVDNRIENNEANQSLTFYVDSEKLSFNKDGKASIDLFLTKKIKWTNLNTGYEFTNKKAFGAFRVFINK
jgi:hypothetical protein